MILSPCSNPPYRSPVNSTSPPPRRSAAPPKSSQSPKRKRSDSSEPHALLQIETREISESVESGANSPRTKVAERLRGLDLCSTPKAKRVRRTSTSGGRRREGMEIEETPQAGFHSSPSSSSSSPLPRGFMQEALEVASNHAVRRPISTPPLPSGPRLNSPLLPPSILSAASSFNTTDSFSDSDDPLTQALPDSPTALTWQEDEITGQEIDPSHPDDDGEGINGIGFKPTPAMAQARSLRRRQQVNEWKAREAKEARQKRLDRRRGGAGGRSVSSGGGGGDGKRSVRFVGFG